jgi:xylulokinase
MATLLGLDASTQSLSAVLLDADGELLEGESVVYGRDLPEHGSPHGYLASADPATCHADPTLWAAALDMLLARLVARGVDLAAVAGVSGAAQQHGSVYLAAPIALERDTPDLRTHVATRLSRPTAPIWLDASTRTECDEIARAAGGEQVVVEITGSRPIERFTGPQIRKLFKTEPDVYEKTREIHLVSSFMASLLVGRTAPIDLADGAGMNLIHLGRRAWSEALLRATAPDLAERLPPVVPSTRRIGEIAAYFTRRYGFRAGTPVFAFTGDNPSSLVGLGATSPGDSVISLGTSDTYFAATETPRPDPAGFGHVFGNPAGGFMSLVCFANGSLARERIAERCGMTWDAFEEALASTPPGNAGNLMLPYFVPEMTPLLSRPELELFGTTRFERGEDAPALARAVVEAQAVTMRAHSGWMGPRPRRIRVTGGASKNQAILQVLADVLQAELRPMVVSNASAMGAALRAAHGALGIGWSDLYERFSAPDAKRAVRPRAETRAVYDQLEQAFLARLHERS